MLKKSSVQEAQELFAERQKKLAELEKLYGNKKALNESEQNKIPKNSLSEWDLKVKFVFQMIDETNSIPQLYCMASECKEEGRPHIVAYIENRIAQLRERFA